jgi:hypothetical protein
LEHVALRAGTLRPEWPDVDPGSRSDGRCRRWGERLPAGSDAACSLSRSRLPIDLQSKSSKVAQVVIFELLLGPACHHFVKRY